MARETYQNGGAYGHFNPQYSKKSKFRFLGRQSGFIWLVISSVFVISAFLETRAGVHSVDKFKYLTPDICAQYLAGENSRNKGPRYSTYGMGKNPVPADLPNAQLVPKIGFEIAPSLPAQPNLPPRGVAGWVEVDPATGQTSFNGQPIGSHSGISQDELVDACLALMSDK